MLFGQPTNPATVFLNEQPNVKVFLGVVAHIKWSSQYNAYCVPIHTGLYIPHIIHTNTNEVTYGTTQAQWNKIACGGIMFGQYCICMSDMILGARQQTQ